MAPGEAYDRVPVRCWESKQIGFDLSYIIWSTVICGTLIRKAVIQ